MADNKRIGASASYHSLHTTKEVTMFQQLILIGNLGNSPELRYTPTGQAYASFRLAVNRRWTGENGQPMEKTTWFNITAWQRQAELSSQYLDKGRRVMVIGEIEGARPYTDRDGNQRASIDVRAREIRFMDGRNTGQEASVEEQANGIPEAIGAEQGDIPF
jgi:single-strand DNA-binding protein